MGYSIPGELFTMLAQAQGQPSGWYKDLGAATGAVNSFTDSLKGYRETKQKKRLDTFFDTPVPNDTLKRVLPGAPTDGSVTYRDLGGLSKDGLMSSLKAPDRGDPLALSILGSGGDPARQKNLYSMFTSQTDPQGNPVPVELTPSTIKAAGLMKPPKPSTPRTGGSASPEVQTLKALQGNLQKTLGSDVSEAERKTATANLAAVNRRLARLGGVTLEDTPAPVPRSEKAPVPAAIPDQKKTSSLVQQLLSALTQ
jgi:hypothetical protein